MANDTYATIPDQMMGPTPSNWCFCPSQSVFLRSLEKEFLIAFEPLTTKIPLNVPSVIRQRRK